MTAHDIAIDIAGGHRPRPLQINYGFWVPLGFDSFL